MKKKLVSRDAITVDWLKSKKACANQVERFRKVFGDRAELTRANLNLAMAHKFDLDWLARKLLSSTAQRAYHETIAAPKRAYDEAKAAILADILALDD